MKNLSKLLILPAALFGLVAFSQIAAAQATRTWISGVGDDANPCSRTAPCKTFAGAISKTAASGEINCLDPGAFGGVTITKSITLRCDYTEAGVLVSGTNAIVVNAGAADVVNLIGLDIEGLGTGLNGVRYLAGAELNISKAIIRGFRGPGANGNGISVGNSSGLTKLAVIDSLIVNNGTGTTGAGIQIAPIGTGGAEVVIKNTEIVKNTVGVRADSTNTAGAIDVTISDSTAAYAPFHGFVAIGTNGRVRMMLDGVVSANNDGEGIRVAGVNANLRLGRSTINYNEVGIAVVSSGNILSYGTNQFNGNTNDGVIPAIDPMR